MRVIGLAGWSGAGKTTLLVKLIPVLRQAGLKVSTVKHAHHAFDVDQPGKDSFEHRRAGATEVLVASARRFALIHEHAPGEQEPGLAVLLRLLLPADLVIVEGFKNEAHPKIEVHRAENAKPLLLGGVPNVCAVASDTALGDIGVPVLPLGDIGRIAEAVREMAQPLAAVLDELGRTAEDRR